jgi:hypothetical protein
MSLPITGGAPSYVGTFIPQIWSGKLIENFYAATVLAQIANTDYEGEIKKQGDIVKIRTTPLAVINDYTRNSNIVYEQPNATVIDLDINKGKYYAGDIDDVSAYQQDVKIMNKWGVAAGEQMKIEVDRDVLSTTYLSAATGNKGATAGIISGNINLGVTGTPVQVTATNVIDVIIRAAQALDEQNAPESGRFIVIPAWMSSLVKTSDLKSALVTGDNVSPLRNGQMGMIDRFTVFKSNLLPNAVDGAFRGFRVLAGTKDALTFAAQMTNMQTGQREAKFAQYMRGLMVYGHKVVKPEALVDLYVRQ